MPLFDQDSMSKLSMCHPEMQVLMYEVIRHIECTIKSVGQDKKPSTTVEIIPTPESDHRYESSIYFCGFVRGIAARLLAEGKMTYGITHRHVVDDICHFDLVIG